MPDPVARLQFLRSQIEPGRYSRRNSRKANRYSWAIAIMAGLVLAIGALLRPWAVAPAPKKPVSRQIVRQASYPAAAVSRVWLVESSGHSDQYSNGLRVENQFATGTAPRRYLAFTRSPEGRLGGEWRDQPVGIVFHTTESHIVPFEEDQNRELRRHGEGLLEYVSRRKSYHFVIDRFGRVFRVVGESDYANHAGNSVWADDQRIYLNLNQSFFGVAFEAKKSSGDDIPVNAAQVHAARILVEMLRARYSIAAGNCVAHGQVSVNPGNGRAGFHTDWVSNLPFADLGLSNNYKRPLASVALFGFEPDESLLESGSALGESIEEAERTFQQAAAARDLTPARYRAVLQADYRKAIERQRRGE
jgi:hypothetical protein